MQVFALTNAIISHFNTMAHKFDVKNNRSKSQIKVERKKIYQNEYRL